jgi:hypothetical protein
MIGLHFSAKGTQGKASQEGAALLCRCLASQTKTKPPTKTNDPK